MAQIEPKTTMLTIPAPDQPTVMLPSTSQAADPPSAQDEEHAFPSSKIHSKGNTSNPALVELNAQLYTRGLTRSGLKLEGLNNKAQDQVIKVFSKLLDQRAVRWGFVVSAVSLICYRMTSRN